jgi:hypothetical protein
LIKGKNQWRLLEKKHASNVRIKFHLHY